MEAFLIVQRIVIVLVCIAWGIIAFPTMLLALPIIMYLIGPEE